MRAAAFALTLAATVLSPALAATAASPDYPPTSATASGHVYLDTNGNGVQDPGEPNLPNVRVVVTFAADECRDFAEAICSKSVFTDANGNWTAEIAPGSASAHIDPTTLPPNVVQTEGTNPTGFNAIAGQITDGGTDGFAPAGTVTGHIYLDTNGNGTQDPGEPNLPGVEIIITDANGNTQTVTTDINGDWITSVPPGTTTIRINESTLPQGVTLTEGSSTYTITAVSDTNVSVGRNGYTRNEGTVPKTGTDSTTGGIRLGLGLTALGFGLVSVSRVRRRQTLSAG